MFGGGGDDEDEDEEDEVYYRYNRSTSLAPPPILTIEPLASTTRSAPIAAAIGPSMENRFCLHTGNPQNE